MVNFPRGVWCDFFFHAVILPLTPDLLFYRLVIISPDHPGFVWNLIGKEENDSQGEKDL
jgi:hypothetical protein